MNDQEFSVLVLITGGGHLPPLCTISTMHVNRFIISLRQYVVFFVRYHNLNSIFGHLHYNTNSILYSVFTMGVKNLPDLKETASNYIILIYGKASDIISILIRNMPFVSHGCLKKLHCVGKWISLLI